MTFERELWRDAELRKEYEALEQRYKEIVEEQKRITGVCRTGLIFPCKHQTKDGRYCCATFNCKDKVKPSGYFIEKVLGVHFKGDNLDE